MTARKFKLANGIEIEQPSLEDAYTDGFNSGAKWARLGQIYYAGGPWVPKRDMGSDHAWICMCEYAAIVNAKWRDGWRDGNSA